MKSKMTIISMETKHKGGGNSPRFFRLIITRALLRLERTINLIQGRGGGEREGGRE